MSELHIIPPKLRLDIALLYLFVRIRTFLSRHFSLTPSPFIRDNLILNDKDLKQTPLLFLIPQNLWKYKMGGSIRKNIFRRTYPLPSPTNFMYGRIEKVIMKVVK